MHPESSQLPENITSLQQLNPGPHVNSLKIAEKVPGAWLVQIKNASHAVVNQYPAEVGKIMNTFLPTTSPSH